jgi:hypothetical protein
VGIIETRRRPERRIRLEAAQPNSDSCGGIKSPIAMANRALRFEPLALSCEIWSDVTFVTAEPQGRYISAQVPIGTKQT